MIGSREFPTTAVITISVIGLVVFYLIGGPQYNVWQQSLNGKAELQKAEYTRQVAVLEAQAKMDSASKLADAEVERAKGVAEAWPGAKGKTGPEGPDVLLTAWRSRSLSNAA